MKCFCCETNKATHNIVSSIDGSEVPYCDECDDSLPDYKLVAEFGSVIHIGSKEECEMIRAAMIRYGIRFDKLSIEENSETTSDYE